jgi:hypothetical protein
MIKCEKCGKEFKAPQNLKMHSLYCKGKNEEENNGKKEKGKKIPTSQKEKREHNEEMFHVKHSRVCEHEFKALTRNIQSQDRAILAGYDAVCVKCGELM